MTKTKMAQHSSHHQPTVPVTVEFEVIQIHHEVLACSPESEDSIGTWLDNFIQQATQEGDQLGRMTIDLAEFSKAFIPTSQKNPKELIR